MHDELDDMSLGKFTQLLMVKLNNIYRYLVQLARPKPPQR